MNVEILIAPEGTGISFREVGFKIAEALKKTRQTIKVSVDPWTKSYFPNITFSPLGFATWDLFIMPMTIAPNAITMFGYYSSPFMSKKAIFYGVCEGHPIISEFLKTYISGKVVVPSEFCKQMLKEIGVETKAVIPHGLKPQEFAYNQTEVEPIRKRVKGKTLIYYLSNGDIRKGIPLLLQAFKIVHNKHPDTLLWLDVWAETFREQHSETARKLGLQDSVIIKSTFGKMTRQTIAAKYHSADLIVHPAHAEGFGLPIVEAMMCGKAPIIVDAPPMNEHVDESCGFLVPVTDIKWHNYRGIMDFKLHMFTPEDYAEAMLYAIEHPAELQEKGIKAFEKAITNYNYIKTYRKFLTL